MDYIATQTVYNVVQGIIMLESPAISPVYVTAVVGEALLVSTPL